MRFLKKTATINFPKLKIKGQLFSFNLLSTQFSSLGLLSLILLLHLKPLSLPPSFLVRPSQTLLPPFVVRRTPSVHCRALHVRSFVASILRCCSPPSQVHRSYKASHPLPVRFRRSNSSLPLKFFVLDLNFLAIYYSNCISNLI